MVGRSRFLVSSIPALGGFWNLAIAEFRAESIVLKNPEGWFHLGLGNKDEVGGVSVVAVAIPSTILSHDDVLNVEARPHGAIPQRAFVPEANPRRHRSSFDRESHSASRQ